MPSHCHTSIINRIEDKKRCVKLHLSHTVHLLAKLTIHVASRLHRVKLCLVNLLRLQFWADSVSDKLKALDASDEEGRKRLYMEARLGSKVMVAKSKKISGGATVNVFMLKSLQLRECLDDLTYYVDRSSKRKMDQYKEDLIESLASIVEFDGLETTQDDSPRSSLTLNMYNSQKSAYVQRMLGERIVPLTDDILRLFGPETRVQTESYMREFYPSEIKTTIPM